MITFAPETTSSRFRLTKTKLLVSVAAFGALTSFTMPSFAACTDTPTLVTCTNGTETGDVIYVAANPNYGGTDLDVIYTNYIAQGGIGLVSGFDSLGFANSINGSGSITLNKTTVAGSSDFGVGVGVYADDNATVALNGNSSVINSSVSSVPDSDYNFALGAFSDDQGNALVTVAVQATASSTVGRGIRADAYIGNTTVLVDGAVTGVEGMDAHTGFGNTNVTVNGTVLGTGRNAISATSGNIFVDDTNTLISEGGGNTTVTVGATGDVEGAETGIWAWTRSGNTIVTSALGSEVLGVRDGMQAEAGYYFYQEDIAQVIRGGSGNASVTAGGKVTGGERGATSWAYQGDASATALAGSVVTGTTDVGLRAQAGNAWYDSFRDVVYNDGSGNATAINNGNVTGFWNGVQAETRQGTAKLTTGIGSVSTATGMENGFATGYGVSARAGYDFEDGLGNVIAGGGGTVIVEHSGTATGTERGVSAGVVSGTVSVTASETSVSSGGNRGISAGAGQDYIAGSGGNVTVVANGKATGGERGVHAFTELGIVSVSTGSASETIGLNNRGINAGATSGSSSVDIAGKVTGGTEGVGVWSDDTGTASAIIRQTAVVVGQSNHGLDVFSFDNLASAVVQGKVTGANFGVISGSVEGSATVTLELGTVVEGKAESGAVAFVEQAGKTATVNVKDATVTGGFHGVVAASEFGNAVVNMTDARATVSGKEAGVGIFAFQDGSSGNATGTINGIVTGDIFGVDVYSSGGNAIATNAGNVSGVEAGFHLNSESLTGQRELTNLAPGYIHNKSNAFGDLAVELAAAEPGTPIASNFTNLGRVDGRVKANINGNITNSGLWNTLGESYADNGTLANTASGRIVGAHSAATNEVTILRSNTVSNFGLMSIVDALAGSGNKNNDLLLIDAGSYAGGGTIAMDGYLDTLAASSTDRVHVLGDATGTTLLSINNTSATGGALIDEATGNGIIVAAVDGTATGNTFLLANGVVSGGLFDYYLIAGTDPAYSGTTYELFSRPNDGSAGEAPMAASAANGVWDHTVTAFLDRQLELRNNLTGEPVITAAADVGPSEQRHVGTTWLEASAGKVDHKGTSNFNGRSVDVGFDQTISSIVGGADFGHRMASGGTLLFGVIGGYVSSDIDFSARTNSIDLKGYTAGVYASYLQDGYFLSSVAKADFLKATHSVGANNGKTDVTSFGLRGDAGYRFDMGNVAFEPLLSASFQTTDIEAYSVGLIGFTGSSNSFGAFGAGLRTTYESQMLQASLAGRVWREVGGDSEAGVSVGGAPQATSTSSGAFSGFYGEVEGSLALKMSESIAVYGGGNLKFNDDTNAKTGFAGLNVSW